MTPTVALKIEMGIAAQQIVAQSQLMNGTLDDAIVQGLEKAIDEMGDNFSDIVCEAFKETLHRTIATSVNSWNIKAKVEKIIDEKMGQKIEALAERWADQALKNIGPSIESK